MFGLDKCGLDNKVSDGRFVYYIYITVNAVCVFIASFRGVKLIAV